MAYASFVYYPRWNKVHTEATISFDVSGYYWYLPSIFIYKDLKHQAFKDSVFNKYQPSVGFQQGYQLPDSNYVLKYSAGMAVMYLPFFTAAHLVAGPFGYPCDGFSTPYQLAIQFGSFLIAIIGIWYLRKLLLKYYEDKVVAIVLLILVVGTNYLNCAVIDGAMSHNWLFTLYVFLLLNTIHFYETFRLKYAVRIGFIIGLATLARPTEALACLIPLLWGINSIAPSAIGQRIKLLMQHFRLFVVAMACAAAVVSIQFIYWKYASGHWVVYSYQDQHLFFRSPNFMNYTFSYRSGWLLYSPMLLLAFAGLVPLLINGKNKIAITTFFLLNYYIICAWSIWWFGGRAMVQSYPVLMFPLASLVSTALNRKALGVLLTPVVLLCAYVNIWFTHQCHKGKLYDTQTMTKPYFMRIAGRWSVPENVIVLNDNAELYEGLHKNEQVLWKKDFAKDTVLQKALPAISGRGLALSAETKDIIEYKFSSAGNKHQWLRFQADFKCLIHEDDLWKMAQFVGRLYKGGVKQKENMYRVYRLLGDNETRTLYLDMNTRGVDYDSISVGFWNGSSDKPLLIDNIKVNAFDEGK